MAGPKRASTRVRWDRDRLRRAAASVLSAGLKAADPARLVRRHLRTRGGSLWVGDARDDSGRGRIVLVAAGKAATTMTRAAEEVLGKRLEHGLAIDVASLAPGLTRVVSRVAGHPVPDDRGLRAATEVEALCRDLRPSDRLLVLLSGGASALLPAPAPGIPLHDKASVTSLLLEAGATISEINTVRKHLSRLKGGGLARLAAPARVACLVLSDVVGDDPSTIASGPTVPDPTTYAMALDVLTDRGILESTPATVRDHLEAGRRGGHPETPKPGDPVFRRVATHIIGSNRSSVSEAAREARRLGLRTLVLTTRLEGEAREAARVLVAVLRECVESGTPLAPPVCLLAGGETTVTVRGPGRGGRNQEIAVAAAEALRGFPYHAVVASLATDGIDGKSDAAGGVADQASAVRAADLGLGPPATFLAANDSYRFLAPLGDLILTGPTGTNVVDLTVLLAGSPARGGRPNGG